MENKLIVKSNPLIRARYDYSMAELRLIITVVSQINSNDIDFKEYSLQAKEYSEMIDSKFKDEYARLQELGNKLMSKPIKIQLSAKNFLICNWFNGFKYENGEIKVSFHPDLKPHLLQLKEQFTSYKLENILKMKSIYSIRIYELAKSWESKGSFTMDLNELKEVLGAKETYPLYADFKKRVLERALIDINENSDIVLIFREIKTARKVTAIYFKLDKKEYEKNHTNDLKEFKKWVRAKFINIPLCTTKKANGAIITIAVGGDKKVVYDFETAKIFSTKESEIIWKYLFENQTKIIAFKQTTINFN